MGYARHTRGVPRTAPATRPAARLRTVAAALLLVAAGAGCTAGEPATPLTSGDLDRADAALRSWIAAYLRGDADAACPRQSERFTRAAVQEAQASGLVGLGDGCAEAVRESAAVLARFADEFEVEGTRVLEREEDRVVLEVRYVDGTGTAYALVREGERWLVDADEGDYRERTPLR